MGFKVQFRLAGTTIHQDVIYLPHAEVKLKTVRELARRGGDTAVVTDQSTGKEYLVKR